MNWYDQVVARPAVISANNPQSISQQLRLELLKQVREASIAPGKRIPSERELAERYKISRTSVREAIAQLLIEGVLVRGGGRGTYVAEGMPAVPRGQLKRQVGFWIGERIFLFVQAGYNRILAGASEACYEAGYGLQFLPIDDRKMRELLDRGVPTDQLDGSILAGGANRDLVATLETSGIPLMLVDLLTGGGTAESIHIDYESGTKAAVDHLLSLGHTNVGFIGFAHSHKYESYWRSLDERGMPYHPRSVEFLEASDLSASTVAGFAAMQTILKRPPLPSAVIVTNDCVALGAMEALNLASIPVPEQMSIIGFDDLIDGPVPLTTVRVDLIEVGRVAARRLIAWIEKGERPVEPTRVPVELVIRASTAAPVRASAEALVAPPK